MLTYLLRRILLMFPTLIGVTALVFFIMANSPGGFTVALDQDGSQTEGQDAKRFKKLMERRFGVDKPQPVQYGRWLNQVSPIGFVMSGDITFDEEQAQTVQQRLAGQAFDTHPNYLRRAAGLALDIAAYRQEPVEDIELAMLDLLSKDSLADTANITALFDLIDATPTDAEEFEREVQELLADRGLGRAQNRVIEELAFEMTGRSRVLFNKPTLKMPDLGVSVRERPVTEMILDRLPNTLLLNILSIPLIYIVAILVGLRAARRRGGVFDVASGTITVGLWSMPVIWAGMLCIGYLANKQYLHWFPTGQLHDPQADQMAFWPIWDETGFRRGYLLDLLWHLVLPVLCLTYTGFAVLSKVMRGAILDNLSADYVRTAKAKGLSENAVMWGHVFRNSILPLITMFAAVLPALFVGSVVVEWIFSIPGMGDLSIQAAVAKDRQVVMATVLIGGVIKLVSEVIRDLCYALADPRVSYD